MNKKERVMWEIDISARRPKPWMIRPGRISMA